MLGKPDQKGLWEADRLYLDHVGKDTFYGLRLTAGPAVQRWRDYCPDNGRDSVPPSLLATALLLRNGERRRGQGEGRLDIWKVALGIEIPLPRARCCFGRS